jgi:hypothetical protein
LADVWTAAEPLDVVVSDCDEGDMSTKVEDLLHWSTDRGLVAALRAQLDRWVAGTLAPRLLGRTVPNPNIFSCLPLKNLPAGTLGFAPFSRARAVPDPELLDRLRWHSPAAVCAATTLERHDKLTATSKLVAKLSGPRDVTFWTLHRARSTEATSSVMIVGPERELPTRSHAKNLSFAEDDRQFWRRVRLGFFDASLERLRAADLHERRAAFALLRYEFRGETDLNACRIFGPRPDSMDTWIVHSSQELPPSVLQFELGMPGCDNKFAYLLDLLGFTVYNPAGGGAWFSGTMKTATMKNQISRGRPSFQ